MRPRTSRWAALAALLLLAGCASTPEPGSQSQAQVLRQVATGLVSQTLGRNQATGNGKVSQAQISQALATQPGPLAVFGVEDRNAEAVIIEIARNGNYRTFGTSQRQSITFLNGTVTATRGLGADLMAAETDELVSHVSHRREGTVPYVLHFVNGEDRGFTLSFNCNIVPRGTTPVTQGTIRTTAHIVDAHCISPSRKFKNSYLVAPSGQIIGARQWLGDLTGFVNSAQLRG